MSKLVSATFKNFALAEIGYTSHAPTCVSCEHFKELDGPIDRMWTPVCGVLGERMGLIELPTKSGTCNRYEAMRHNCVPADGGAR